MRQILKIVFTISLSIIACCKESKNLKLKNKITIAIGETIGPLSPVSYLGFANAFVPLVYAPLLILEQNGQVRKILIEDYEVNNRGDEYIFVLKERISSSDVVHSVELAKKSKSSLYSKFLENLDSIEILSDRKIKFKLKRYDRLFLGGLSFLRITLPDREKAYSGEFNLVKQTNDYLLLERRVKRVDKVNFIEVVSVPNPRIGVRKFIGGEVDILIYADKLELDLIGDIQGVKSEVLNADTLFFLINNQTSPEPLNWNYLNSSVKRNKLVESVGAFRASPAYIPVPKVSEWYDEKEFEKIRNKKYLRPYNKQSIISKKLVILKDQPSEELIARYLKRWFETEGIKLEIREVSQDEFYLVLSEKKDFDLLLTTANLRYPFVNNYIGFRTPKVGRAASVIGYSNPEVDKYLDEARYSKDFPRAKKFFVKAIKALMEDPPGLFLFWSQFPIVYSENCQGLDTSSVESFFLSFNEVSCNLDLKDK